MANKPHHPTHRASAKGEKLQPVNWGTAADIQKVDQQRQAAAEKAQAIYSRLYGKGASSDNRARITPFLLIRYSATATLAQLVNRPVASGEVFWESPDIWVDSPDPSGNPVPGQPNYVNARVFNLGAFIAAPVKVDFYWGDPSIGLDAAHMHPIGTEYVEIQSLSSVEVRCSTPWIPVFENGGHECLMVNCSDWVADPIIDPFQPTLDRHVGQRNVQLVNASSGMLVEIPVRLSNIFAADVTTAVLANITHLEVQTSRRQVISTTDVLSQVLAFGGQKEATGVTAVQRRFDAVFLEAELSRHIRFYNIQPIVRAPATTRGSEFFTQTQAMQRSPSAARVSTSLLQTVLHAGEQRSVNLRLGVPQSAQPGEYIVCRLFQTAEGRTFGGYTIVIMISE